MKNGASVELRSGWEEGGGGGRAFQLLNGLTVVATNKLSRQQEPFKNPCDDTLAWQRGLFGDLF